MKTIPILFAAAGLAFAAAAQPHVGQPAPDFSATDISGKTIKLSDYKGKIVVLEAYESSCIFVRKEYESGAMQELQRQMASNGVVWLVVSPGFQPRDKPAEARSEWTNLNMTITDWIIDDHNQSLCKRYGMRATPEMYVIDKDGLIAYWGAVDDVQNPK